MQITTVLALNSGKVLPGLEHLLKKEQGEKWQNVHPQAGGGFAHVHQHHLGRYIGSLLIFVEYFHAKQVVRLLISKNIDEWGVFGNFCLELLRQVSIASCTVLQCSDSFYYNTQ